MSIIVADRVKETTVTTGTGTLSLLGAVAQFQTFVAGAGTGQNFDYCLLSGNGTDWEVGRGTVTSGTPDTLSRDTIYESSNADAAISASGTSTVYLTASARVLTRKRTLTKTGDYTLTAADSGTILDNIGAAGTVILTLPTNSTSNVGIWYGGLVHASQILRFLAPASATISVGDVTSGTAGNVQSSTAFSYIELYCPVSGKWVATTLTGAQTWTVT